MLLKIDTIDDNNEEVIEIDDTIPDPNAPRSIALSREIREWREQIDRTGDIASDNDYEPTD